ncbi:MAG: hypothetical protein KAS12_03275 [Candidatus Aenigmarchaeota archaeon]|nr:hypothetical protein [Candidatus Aenigmarchaeota archaeon]
MVRIWLTLKRYIYEIRYFLYMGITEKNKRIVFSRCGNRCSFSNCKQIIAFKGESEKYTNSGELAHIKGDKKGSERYDSSQSDGDCNNPDNLILLCGTHHKIIDDQSDIYTVNKLTEMKQQHEKWVLEQYSKNVNELTFAELEVIKKFIISNDIVNSDMSVLHLRDKIKKNEISSKTEIVIKLGLARTKLVKKYIDTNLDLEFGERLKMGFIKEYNKQKKQFEGDALFDKLHNFSSGGSTDFRDMAASLTILCYFFEKCDVFEK